MDKLGLKNKVSSLYKLPKRSMNEDWGIYYLLKNAPSLPIIVRNDPMYFYRPAGRSGSIRKALCVEKGLYADISAKLNSEIILIIHSPQECFVWVAS